MQRKKTADPQSPYAGIPIRNYHGAHPANMTEPKAARYFSRLEHRKGVVTKKVRDAGHHCDRLIAVEAAAGAGAAAFHGFEPKLAKRLATYSRTIRCNYTRLAAWTCSTCREWGSSTALLGSHETSNRLWKDLEALGEVRCGAGQVVLTAWAVWVASGRFLVRLACPHGQDKQSSACAPMPAHRMHSWLTTTRSWPPWCSLSAAHTAAS